MSSELLKFAGTIVLRVTLVFMSAGLVSISLRRASAALRHWVWVLAMAVALLMPALVMMAPRWDVTLPQASQSGDVPMTESSRSRMQPTTPPVTVWNRGTGDQAPSTSTTTASNMPATSLNPTAPSVQAPTAKPSANSGGFRWPDWKTGLVIFWVLGAGAVLASGVWQYRKIARLTQVGTPVDMPQVNLSEKNWQVEIDHLREVLNIRRPIRWVVTDKITVPMTIGLRRPVILFPAESAEWKDERRWVVLVHEGIHIARWDALMGWLSLVMVAVHWFNPLAWMATRRLAIEGETACDDRVLQLGTAGPDYAAHLLAIAQKNLPIAPSVSHMANPHHLGERIPAILDQRRRRGVSKWQRLIGLVLVLVLIAPATTLKPNPIDSRGVRVAHADDDITLTVALPDDFDPAALQLDEFEAAHPGVKVVVRHDDVGLIKHSIAYDPYAYLDKMPEYADTADVLYFVNANYVTPLATRAGVFLNLAPLVAADVELDTHRYFPAAWASYQWDGGVWALPTTMNPVYVVYNRPAFDAAGLTYPDERWSMDQYAQAARALTFTDPNGNTIPGLAGDPTYLFRALLGRPFYQMVEPADAPSFSSDTELRALAEQWLALVNAGAAAPIPEEDGLTDWVANPAYEFLSPLQISTSAGMRGNLQTTSDDADWLAALLPGDVACLESVGGFAISAGTASPELAYALAKHLSLLNAYGNTASMSAVWDGGGSLDLQRAHFNPGSSAAQRSADFEAATHSIALTERVWTPFLDYALSAVVENGGDLITALQKFDAQAGDALARADEQQPDITIPPAPPAVDVPAGEVALQFQAMMSADRIPNLEAWQQAAADFAAQDDEVFGVNVLTGQQPNAQADCYLSDAPVGEVAPLNLDPLMAADPDFDKADFVPGVLPASGVVGYPLVMRPETLWADMKVVRQTGMSFPDDDWDITTFVEAIEAVKDQGLAEHGLFSMHSDGLHLIMLMAAYDVLPIDYRTTPATIDLTSPTTVDGIRRVLDLEKAGYISDPTAGATVAFEGPIVTVTTADNLYYVLYPLYADIAYLPDYEILPMNYPHGREFTPLAYLVQSGYINSTTPHAEACYRWLRFMAGRPELVVGIPVRHSVLDSPSLDTLYGPQLARNFRAFVTQLESPSALIVPVAWDNNAQVETAVGLWIREAFDAYIADGADLDRVLTQAQDRIDTFRGCMAGVSTGDDFIEVMRNCAVGVDPDILTKEPFSSMYGVNAPSH